MGNKVLGKFQFVSSRLPQGKLTHIKEGEICVLDGPTYTVHCTILEHTQQLKQLAQVQGISSKKWAMWP